MVFNPTSLSSSLNCLFLSCSSVSSLSCVLPPASMWPKSACHLWSSTRSAPVTLLRSRSQAQRRFRLRRLIPPSWPIIGYGPHKNSKLIAGELYYKPRNTPASELKWFVRQLPYGFWGRYKVDLQKMTATATLGSALAFIEPNSTVMLLVSVGFGYLLYNSSIIQDIWRIQFQHGVYGKGMSSLPTIPNDAYILVRTFRPLQAQCGRFVMTW